MKYKNSTHIYKASFVSPSFLFPPFSFLYHSSSYPAISEAAELGSDLELVDHSS